MAGTFKVSAIYVNDAVTKSKNDNKYGFLRLFYYLMHPTYQKTAVYGHFGRELPDFTWEKTDKAGLLFKAL
jgi:S-adenosylmethionine synthetase